MNKQNLNSSNSRELKNKINNPNFKGVEFDPLLFEAETNVFTMSPTRWVELTNANAKGNIRDYVTINELICLSNMENINAVLINESVSQSERLVKLNQIAIQQMRVLSEVENRNILE